ncbi:MAG: Holliday junction resolvase RuvX [Gammaproteobacteria bacterium]
MPNSSLKATVVLGFDFGLKRIGTAVGQTTTKTATPLSVLKARDGHPNWQEVDRLLQEWQPIALVVGLPIDMDDEKQQILQAAQAFMQALQRRYPLPVHGMDERLSTKEAREHIFAEGGYRALQKISVDCYAAKLILESWLRGGA